MTTNTIEDIERRVRDIEDPIADIPQMMTLRLESLTASQQEASARLALLDKQMATLLRDVRDFRAAVTRQLIAQDERFASQDERLEKVEQRIEQFEQRFAQFEQRFEQRMGSVDTKLDTIVGALGTK